MASAGRSIAEAATAVSWLRSGLQYHMPPSIAEEKIRMAASPSSKLMLSGH
jgi:hypothetical protein